MVRARPCTWDRCVLPLAPVHLDQCKADPIMCLTAVTVCPVRASVYRTIHEGLIVA